MRRDVARNVSTKIEKIIQCVLSEGFYCIHEISQFISPAWPIVVDIESPVVEPCWHALLFKNSVKVAGAWQGVVFPSSLPDAHDDPAAAVHLHPRMVVWHLTEKILRRVGVRQVVGVIWKSIMRIVESAQRYQCVEDVRSTEEEVAGMKCSE